MSKYTFIIAFVFLFIGFVNSQPDLKFVRYTTEQGLANDDVLSICQDNYGFMWFGTKDGCSRFDGMEFKTFQYNQTKKGSVAPGWVNGIVCDKNNDLWIALSGLGNSLMKYDYEKDIFIDMSKRLKEHLNFKGETINCWTIFCDSEGLLWLQLTAPDNCVVQYNPQNNEIKTIESQNGNFVRGFMEDVDKNIWLIGYRISVYNKKNNSIISPDLLSSNCAFQDSDQKIWIGTGNGLHKLISPISEFASFKNYNHEPDNSNSLSNSLVYGIVEDVNNNILIGTLNGFCLLDKETEKIYRYYNDEIDPESINSNLIRTLYRDKRNTIWIGTSSGIGKLQTKNFQSYSQSLYRNSISHNKVQCVSQAYGSEVWIGTPKGIDVFDRATGKFRFFAGITRDAKGLYGAPLAMSPDANKGMWVGTWRGGFSRFDYATDKFTNYISKPVTKGLSHVFSVYPDGENNLWVGVSIRLYDGFYIYNIEKDTFRVFNHDPDNKTSISSNEIFHITKDSDGRMWIGTNKGLNQLIDIEKGKFERYLENIPVNHFIESSDKHIWIGTEQGLYRLNVEKEEIKKFDTDDGLPGNRVMGILEDEFHYLWISTNNGLARLKQTGDSDLEVTVFRKDEGIRVGNFLQASCDKLTDGAMIFGGSKGFCLFHPDKIEKDTIVPDVVFTNLKIANQTVKIGDTINNQVILTQSITLTKHLILNHKNNELAIEFAGLHYNMPQHNRYAYRLEGYDPQGSNWHYTNAQDREVEYMNLPSGNYIFRVKAANSYGIWSNQPVELKITVLSPWWQTIWFKSLIAVILIFTVFIAVRIRTYSLHKQKQRLKQIVEQRTIELKEMNALLNERKEELEAQAEELSEINLKLLKTNTELEVKTIEVEEIAKQLHEADQSKLQFFANISHEFRTPLTLIISPIEKCLNLTQSINWDKESVRNSLKLMQRNSKRLLRLINQLIDFRKIDQKEKRPNMSNNNIVEFTGEVVAVFSDQAEQKNIRLKFESQFPIINFLFDTDIMEKILYNLISNAIKYTPEGGYVSVQLTVISNQLSDDEKLDNKNTNDNKFNIHNYSPLAHENAALSSSLLIKVVDTGIGIDKENIEKIFDRFYRIENKESLTEEGVGIGLSYAKELVELHKGTISVESVLGKGTAFILQFPIEKENFDDETIKQDYLPIKLNYIRSMIESLEDSNNPASKKVVGSDDIKRLKNTLLIVEDSLELREFISQELQKKYKVIQAKDGVEGFEKALGHIPDIIVSDVMMPGINGVELCKKIKSDENTSHIPVILLTAKTGEENIIKGLGMGADDYITKPFSLDIVKIKIHNILENRRKLREKFSNLPYLSIEEITTTAIDKNFLKKAIQIVEENMSDLNFTNDQFVSLCRLSKSSVYKKIKSLTNQSVSDFISSIRLRKAAELLLVEDKNISEIGYMTGFKDRSVFTRQFTKYFGKSPTQYIREHNNTN